MEAFATVPTIGRARAAEPDRGAAQGAAADRNVAFDAARGIAVIMVVALHAALLPISDVDGTQPISRMALLMLISGALSQSLRWGSPGRSCLRGLKLGWLVLVWTPITMVCVEGTAGLARLPAELLAPTTHLWYIELLALLTLLMPLLARVPAFVPLTVTGAAALAHTAGFRTGVPGWDQSLHFAVFFYAGLYAKPAIDALLAATGRGLGTGLALLAALAALQLLPVPHYLATLGSAALLLCLCHALRDTMPVRTMARMGRRSADVYLPHCAVLWSLQPLLASVLGRLDRPAVLALAAATVLICLALCALADRLRLGWLYAMPRLPVPAAAPRAPWLAVNG